MDSLDIVSDCEFFNINRFSNCSVSINSKDFNIENRRRFLWSHPSEAFPENPFSKGEHYVMAVGYAADGRILIANSSESKAKEGVQFVDLQTILRALNPEAAPEDLTWGNGDRVPAARAT